MVVKNYENRSIFSKDMDKSIVSPFFDSPCRTLTGSRTLPVKWNHQSAVPMTGSARNCLRHLLTSAWWCSYYLFKFSTN